jgi:hypothetical protein
MNVAGKIEDAVANEEVAGESSALCYRALEFARVESRESVHLRFH